MIYLVRKKVKGQTYLFLEERAYINGKSRRIWQKYLGNETKIREMGVTISPKKLEYKTMEFGCSAALYQVAQKIGLAEIIDATCGKERHQNLSLGEYLLIVVLNRCVGPCSKSQLASWFQNDYLSTVFDINPKVLNAQTYWNHYQLLDEEKITQIELQLTRRVVELYKLDLSCLLFDPPNFYTFITVHENSHLPKFGKSKESRHNLRLINVSLLCTRKFSVPLWHYTYEGNVQDAKHFKGVMADINDRFQTIGQEITEIVLIFDKGNHSPKAFHQIDTLQLPFIASLRNSTQKDLVAIPEEEFTFIKLLSTGKQVGYYRLEREIYNQVRTVYVLLDPRKQKRATAELTAKLRLRHTAIDKFLPKLNIKKWRSKEKVERQLRSLIGKKPFADILSFEVSGEFGKLEVTIGTDEEAKRAHLTTLGRSLIFTTQHAWTPEQVISAFRGKHVVEDCFKKLKRSQVLAIRPMYHWTDTCIRAHVFTCVLGLLLLNLLRLELTQKSLTLSHEQLLKALSELQLTQIYTSSKRPPFYRLNRHSSLAAQLYHRLRLKHLLPQ
jgi:transposase